MRGSLLSYASMLAGLRFNFDGRGRFGIPQPAPTGKTKGLGVLRAELRFVEKLRKNKAIPSAARVTRQQIRAAARSEAKKNRISPAEFGRRKMEAIKRGASA